MRHLTIRVAWHDSKWNGRVCAAASRNNYCIALERCRRERNDAEEDRLAGRAWKDLRGDQLPPCREESGAFMNEAEWVRTFEHALQRRRALAATHGRLRSTRVKVAPYTTFAAPYAWMLKANQSQIDDALPQPLPPDVPAPQQTGWVFGRERQEALSNHFFDQLRPEHSLVFFYCKEGQPLGDIVSRLVVGVGRIHRIGKLRFFESAGGPSYPLWEREIHHSIRPEGPDGMLLPYHDYLAPTGDAREDARRQRLLEDIAVTVDRAHVRAFSYAAELASADTALAMLVRCLDAVRLIRTHGIAHGPWDLREGWLNDQIAATWRDRGAFPGVGAALEALGLRVGTAFALDLMQSGLVGPDDNPWECVDAILRGAQDAPKAVYEAHLAPLRQVWRDLPAERRALLQLLSRFDLSFEQLRRWYEPAKRAAAALGTHSDADLLANPYRIAEADLGTSDAPAITMEIIDRGLFPDDVVRVRFPVPKPTAVEVQNDVRRVRGALVAVLRAAADEGDTLLDTYEAVDRIGRLPLARPCIVGADFLEGARADVADVMTLYRVDGGAERPGASVLELAEMREHEVFVRDTLGARAATALPSLGVDWHALLLEAIGGRFHAENARHREALDEQAEALDHITQRKLSVLTGRAGTGKTSVMGALLRCQTLREEGVLLLAPTGKARVRLQNAAGKAGNAPHIKALTIAQFLHALRRYDGDHQRPLFEGEIHKAERNVVIDEASMLTIDDLAAVLRALDLLHVRRIILAGDPNQLPPIGAGRPFADLVAYLDAAGDSDADDAESREPLAAALGRLTVEVRTQTGDRPSDALRLASWFTREPQPVAADHVLDQLIGGEPLNDLDIAFWHTPDDLRERILDKLQEHLHLRDRVDITGFDRALGIGEDGGVPFEAPDAVERFQLLSPTRMQPHGVYALNSWMQRQFRGKELRDAQRIGGKSLGPEEIVHKDKVIQVRNEQRRMYDLAQGTQVAGYLANGEIGLIANGGGEYMDVAFAGHAGQSTGYRVGSYALGDCPLELAHALTVHKAQGSEFDIVFVVVPEKNPRLSRELLYTALTRSRQRLVLLLQGDHASDLYQYSLPDASETARRNSNLFTPAVREVGARLPFFANLIHRTRKGQLVRSKSELVIANMLEDMGLPYHYERAYAGETRPGVKYPDFTFVTASGTAILWEHLGMLGKSDYARAWDEKRQWYAANGITEGQTLFTTRDDERGGLDSRTVYAVALRLRALLQGRALR